MLQAIKDTAIFNNIKQDIVSPSHAYLFYGEDERLNIELAKVFIASIFCGKSACFTCDACKRVEINKNPDMLILDKPNLQVADIESLIDNVQLKPMLYKYKIVFITNAEGINETAQNKLLKTLEEPNPQVVFVLTCTNIEKLLPTIRSRLTKHYVPKISLENLSCDLKMQGINIDKFVHCNITLTEAVKYSTTQSDEILKMVEQSIIDLKSSADIPNIVAKLKLRTENKKEFLNLWLNAINCALTSTQGLFGAEVINYIQTNFKIQVMIKMLKLIDEAIRKVDSNVNYNYVLDQLFYNILKEKYLCK
ncbi:MAG: AAA family ATPase [Clostridia bacterium]